MKSLTLSLFVMFFPTLADVGQTADSGVKANEIPAQVVKNLQDIDSLKTEVQYLDAQLELHRERDSVLKVRTSEDAGR